MSLIQSTTKELMWGAGSTVMSSGYIRNTEGEAGWRKAVTSILEMLSLRLPWDTGETAGRYSPEERPVSSEGENLASQALSRVPEQMGSSWGEEEKTKSGTGTPST